jgi:myo-inositol-1(or 4)-monophosphatase
MDSELGEIIEAAREAAQRAGSYLRDGFATRPTIGFKGEIDLVTERDLKSQEIIFDFIDREFPDHAILGEEDLDIRAGAVRRWVIDPLDGTTNYAHGLPVFCVSLAYQEAGTTRAALIYNPMLEETFWAAAGCGSHLNERRLSVSNEKNLGGSLLATGFPYDLRESPNPAVPLFERFILKARAVRRCGSAALDLAYTAAGRFDGFWELKLSPWDTAAGALLVEEAGGRVSDFGGSPFDPFGKECLASNGRIHAGMIATIRSLPS